MGMGKKPEVFYLPSGDRYWNNEFKTFKAKVYVPKSEPITEIVNFGFKAPYLLVFEEEEKTMQQAIEFARETGLEDIAKRNGSSVVFVYPTCEGGWDNAPYELFPEIVSESKIHQYYKDGMVNFRDRFTGEFKDSYIRGAIFRTYLYGFGKSADFIAKNYMKKVEGEYLWGPGEITPACLILNNLSVIPNPKREDIPVLSIGNSEEVNLSLAKKLKYFVAKDKPDYVKDFDSFIVKFKRWCSDIQFEPDFEELGMVEEAGVCNVNTSSDNCGDDKGTKTHDIGYLACYNKNLFDKGPVPLLLAYHGGGDSCFYISHVSRWWEVAHKHNFLLVAIENHLNSTATEMVELIGKLKEKYNIDEHRIYASGFSMGGCKSWDCYQEYPEIFAGLAPMDATFEVGLNVFGKPAPFDINRSIPVPIFYAGGEITPLPELPFQAEKCWDRMRYVFEVNKVKKPYDVTFEDQASWSNKIWGIDGDRTERIYDKERDAYLTVQYFDSEDGVCRTAFASVSGQGHECRHHTCEEAWKFISKFTR